MTISNYLENLILNHVLTSSTTPFVTTTMVYGSLHTGDPGETGTGNPLASCARMAIEFNTAASATSVNTTTVDFVTSASGTITHLALWDGSATATANCLWSGALATSKNVNVGDTIRLSSGSLGVNLD